jgi:hypothetical protein
VEKTELAVILNAGNDPEEFPSRNRSNLSTQNSRLRCCFAAMAPDGLRQQRETHGAFLPPHNPPSTHHKPPSTRHKILHEKTTENAQTQEIATLTIASI